jgi:truncated hemoglobin YjbI
MTDALDETVADPTLRSDLHGAFQRLADHMRNQ